MVLSVNLRDEFMKVNSELRQPPNDTCVPTVVYSFLRFYNWNGLANEEYNNIQKFCNFVEKYAHRTNRWTYGNKGGIDLTHPFQFLKELEHTYALTDKVFQHLENKSKMRTVISGLVNFGIPSVLAKVVNDEGFHMLVSLEWINDSLTVYDPAHGEEKILWDDFCTDKTNYRVYTIFPDNQTEAVEKIRF